MINEPMIYYFKTIIQYACEIAGPIVPTYPTLFWVKQDDSPRNNDKTPIEIGIRRNTVRNNGLTRISVIFQVIISTAVWVAHRQVVYRAKMIAYNEK